MIHLVCYDVREAKRLRACAQICEQFGIRIQKSFFQCELDEGRLHDLQVALCGVLDLRADYLFFYPMCQSCLRQAMSDGSGFTLVQQKYEVL